MRVGSLAFRLGNESEQPIDRSLRLSRVRAGPVLTDRRHTTSSGHGGWPASARCCASPARHRASARSDLCLISVTQSVLTVQCCWVQRNLLQVIGWSGRHSRVERPERIRGTLDFQPTHRSARCLQSVAIRKDSFSAHVTADIS